MQVFFYGLLMDESVLNKNGVHPSNPRIGYLNNYAIKIGERASLIPSPGKRAYGILMYVPKDELNKLYQEASVADYVPEDVVIHLPDGATITASCYNLPLNEISGTNSVYAQALYQLAKQKGFPNDYLSEIQQMIT